MRTFVQHGRQRCSRNTENLCRACHRKAKWLDDLTFDKAAGMGRIFHTDALHRTHNHLLVVIFIVEVDDLTFGLVDLERELPVLDDVQIPGSFPIAGKLMGFPVRDYGRLQAGGVHLRWLDATLYGVCFGFSYIVTNRGSV